MTCLQNPEASCCFILHNILTYITPVMTCVLKMAVDKLLHGVRPQMVSGTHTNLTNIQHGHKSQKTTIVCHRLGGVDFE